MLISIYYIYLPLPLPLPPLTLLFSTVFPLAITVLIDLTISSPRPPSALNVSPDLISFFYKRGVSRSWTYLNTLRFTYKTHV